MFSSEQVERAQQLIRNSGDFVTAAKISAESPALGAQLRSLHRQGRIFAIQLDGEKRYPRYAFRADLGFGVLPGFEAILYGLRDKDDWQKAFWFEGPNSYLSGKPPKALLEEQIADVERAAQIESEGVQHG